MKADNCDDQGVMMYKKRANSFNTVSPLRFVNRFLDRHRAETHTTGCSQCREECRERGYYHLHRQLHNSLLLHRLQLLFFLNYEFHEFH